MTSSGVTLTWDAVAAADNYDLRRMEMSSNRETSISDVASGYRDDEGVTAATEYGYWVRSVRSRRGLRWESAWSGKLTVTTPEASGPVAPPVPEDLTAEASSAFSVDLDWEASEGAVSYEVRRRAPGEEQYTVIPVTETSHRDDDLASDSVYEYEVQAIGSEEVESGWSSVVEERTDTFGAPENFEAEALSATEVALEWDEVAGSGMEYRVRWKVADAANWGRAQRLTATSYVVSGLSAETEHAFRVFAWHRSSGGVDDRSPAVDTTATTLAADPPDLTVEDETMNSVSLSWSEIADATGYELERRSPFESGAWSVVYGPGSERTYEDTGLDAGTSYGYRVRATLPGDRRTRWSTEAEAMTDAGPPPVPMDVTAHGVSSSMIEVRWTAVDGVTRYRLQRRPDGGGGGDWVAVAAVDPAEFPAYRDSELPADTAYDYRVRSVLEVDGETRRSEWSEPVSARTEP